MLSGRALRPESNVIAASGWARYDYPYTPAGEKFLQSWLELLDAGATCAQISLGGLGPPFATEL
jgi:hypothetical protein